MLNFNILYMSLSVVLSLALKQRLGATRKWPTETLVHKTGCVSHQLTPWDYFNPVF